MDALFYSNEPVLFVVLAVRWTLVALDYQLHQHLHDVPKHIVHCHQHHQHHHHLLRPHYLHRPYHFDVGHVAVADVEQQLLPSIVVVSVD